MREITDNFFLTFRGYWRGIEVDQIPNLPGIYCVYRCNYDFVGQALIPNQLLFIGEGLAARDQILDHERRVAWERHLRPGEELGFSYAPILRTRHQAA